MVGLLQIEKRAPYFRSDCPPGRIQRRQSCFAPGACGLHASFRGKPVEEVPSGVYPNNVTVIEFAAYIRIAFVVNFVSGKNSNVWEKLTSIQHILSILDFDISLPRFNQGPFQIGAREGFV